MKIVGHGSNTPSEKIMEDYLSKRNRMTAPNGKHKGIVKVMRLKALTDEKRKEFKREYKKILGRNRYDQTRRQYVYTKASDGYYYSDCSSSICATFQRIGYKMIPLLNTAGIYQSPLFEEVPVKIAKGQITNPEILKVGDCLLFVGNDSSRPLQIGHVEAVYATDGQPKKKTKGYGKKVRTTANLRLRETPSLDGNILCVMNKGHEFTVRDQKNGWVKACIIKDGKTFSGWCSADYLEG